MWDFNLFGQKFYYIFYSFFLYSFFGWIYESILVSIKKRMPVNRGFLNGPVIPIYGCGAVIVYLAFWRIRYQLVWVFIGSCFLATVLEYITSFYMEKLFHTRWWDYSDFPFNLKGRVCLMVSLFWGILGILVLNVLQPGVNNIINLLPRKFGEILGIILFMALMFDIVITVIYMIKFDRLLARLQELRQDMLEYIGTTKLYETGEELKERLSGLKMAGIFTEIRGSVDTKLHNTKVYKKYSQIEIKELKELVPDMEVRMREFFRLYQTFKPKKIHIRLMKAFPNMKVGKREEALGDLRDKMSRKGVRELSKELKEEVTGTIKGYLSGFLRVTIVGLLVLAQFVMIIYLSLKLREYTVYFYTFIQILSIIVIIVLVNDDRNASYKISWICIIAAFPITGHIMFMLWGNKRRKKIEKHILNKINHGAEFLEYNPEIVNEFALKHPTKSRMTKYLESNHFPLYKNNKVEYYPMGEDAFDAIFKEIEAAERFILIDFFIVGEGTLWDRIHTILVNKLQNGVKVLFLYDDFGAMLRTPNNFKKALESEGFEIRVFNPIHKYTDQLYMNYRSHQKIIVIDGNVGFTGGMNLADEYVNFIPRFGTWKDNAVKVEGDAVWGLTVTFLQMWEACQSGKPMDYTPYRPTKSFEPSDVYCQVVSDGPANNPSNPVENIYKQMIYYAKKILYITTPYLIIEDDMRDALITAAISGVDVRIITPFIPDKKSVKILTNYNYGRLLQAGVRIFEYSPGFIHAKTIISEDAGIVGTINMDYRSFHLHYECGLWFCNCDTVDIIKEDLIKTMSECHEVSYEEWKNRPLSLKISQLVLNVFSTLM